MASNDLFDIINDAARNASAIGIRASLRSMTSQQGDDEQHIFPPTYLGDRNETVHAFTPPDASGVSSHVLVDSRQSFANRVEEIFPELGLPDMQTQVGGELVSVHQLSHRVFDAALRDSTLDGVNFRDSALGKSIMAARMRDAAAVYRYAPQVLLLGGWDSHSGAAIGAKWPTALSIRIWGRDARPVANPAVKIDPLGIEKEAGPVYRAESGEMTFDEARAVDKKGKKGRDPSELGHGNVPSWEMKGALVRAIELDGGISLTRLRRYRFPLNGHADADRDAAGHVVIALLGIAATATLLERGLDLRSGCELDAESAHWWVRRGLADDAPFEVSAEDARAALSKAIDAASTRGLAWNTEPIRLVANEALEEVFRRSR